MEKLVKKFKEFESKNKVLTFLVIILLTILIARFIICYVVDPNLKIGGLELHHFDYGLILLVITSLLMLFGRKRDGMHLIMLAISLGLVIDELWFIRKQIGGNNPAIYNPSSIYVVLVAIIVVLIPKNLFLRKLPALVREKAKINFRVFKNQYGVHAIHFSAGFLTSFLISKFSRD